MASMRSHRNRLASAASALRSRCSVGANALPDDTSSQIRCGNSITTMTMPAIHGSTVPSTARPRAVATVNSDQHGEQDQAGIGGEQQQADLDRQQEPVARAAPRRSPARSAGRSARRAASPGSAGPKSGVGSVIAEMPIISSTAITAWWMPTIARAEREDRPVGRRRRRAAPADRRPAVPAMRKAISASQKASGGPCQVPSWNSCPIASTCGRSPGGAA